MERKLDQWVRGHRVWSWFPPLHSCMNLEPLISTHRMQDMEAGILSRLLIIRVKLDHERGRGSPKVHRELIPRPGLASTHSLDFQPRALPIVTLGTEDLAKCSQLCWRPKDFWVGRQMVPNKQSLDCGHSRRNIHCILCRGWSKCKKQSDAFKVKLGGSCCTYGGLWKFIPGQQSL